MKQKASEQNYCDCSCKKSSGGMCGGFIYCLGVVGSGIFYIQQATTFWAGVVGVLKALVWPAFLVYKLLGM